MATPNPIEQITFTTVRFKDRRVLPSHEVVELLRLYEELPYASMRAAEALRIDGAALRGDALERFRDEELAVAAIIERIKQILGS